MVGDVINGVMGIYMAEEKGYVVSEKSNGKIRCISSSRKGKEG